MKRKIEIVGTTVALLAIPGLALANPDLTVRVSEQGIDMIASHFGYDRDNVTLPNIDEDMGSCWPHDRELHVQDGVGNLAQPVKVKFEVRTPEGPGGGDGGDGTIDITPTTDPNAPAPGSTDDPTTAGPGNGPTAEGAADEGLSGGCRIASANAPALPCGLLLLLWGLRRRRRA